MEMNFKGLQDKAAFGEIGVKLPRFDWERMCEKSRKAPVWVHFGAGNIFRGYIAGLQQKLLDDGVSACGIVAVDTSAELIRDVYHAYDNMTMLVGLKPDGSTDNEVIASVSEAIKADSADALAWERLSEIFMCAGLQMVSFTITEKGYALFDAQGQIFPLVAEDIANGPSMPRHGMAMVAALMYKRFTKGEAPISLVSMDNCSHNGDKLKESILTIARGWQEKGYVSKEFVSYLDDQNKVSFPVSMIDKITPRPSAEISAQLAALGIKGMKLIKAGANFYIAPFVNAEIPEYLIIEDRFPNGRPPLEKAGVYLTDRETVNMTERMKVTTCLNPLHTALAVYGCLLGYVSIADEMKDKELKALVERIGYAEGMPVVTDPRIIAPMEFIKEVIESRLPNPFIPDTPQRIAEDTSQKVPIRFGETIKAYLSQKELKIDDLIGIPLALAGWLRYLLAVDDEGNEMALSPDPMLDELKSHLSGISLGDVDSIADKLKAVLSNKVIFGTDLYKAGMGEKIERLFGELIEAPGAVRSTLKKYLC